MSTNEKVYLAVDLGASGGRVLAGLFNGARLRLEEVHRFDNGGVLANGHMYWDLLALWSHVQGGLRSAATRYGNRVASVGVDSWGVDFGLLGPGDELLGNPYHYRDHRTSGMMEQAFSTVSRAEIFGETGLQFMELNTLYQLLALQRENPRLLESAQALLMIPDLFHWLLTGHKSSEYTNASTTQFCNPRIGSWSRKLFDRFSLPSQILQEIVFPGTELGGLRPDVSEATGLGEVRVVLPGTHDTASAVMAVPATEEPPRTDPSWCYISSGTWSLMGVETPRPVITDECRDLNFTNEVGVSNTIRLLKNIAGLWLVQECRRVWQQEGSKLSWEDMVAQAAASTPLVSLVNPDVTEFVAPANMPQAICDFCRRTAQPVPDSQGAVTRCVFESLALRYRMVLNRIQRLTASSIDTIHIVGGGTQNGLLCQMAADACNCRVLAGPVEATAIGNVMMQSVAQGDVDSISQGREVIRNSFEIKEFTPQATAPWDAAYQRFEELL